jgi:hypothetical protein
LIDDDYIYDASLVSEDIWLDYWKLNGGARIAIERPNRSGGDVSLMQPPSQNIQTIKGVRALVFDVDIDDIRTSAGRIRIGDKKFETLDRVIYGDFILYDGDKYEVFRVDKIDIGEMTVYATKAHKVT